jgi:CheY-like chemotaxis protein
MAQRCALIVDDSRTARQALGQVLASNQLRVETAESAEQALEFLSHARPDVIFMDHMMPGMDGFQAVRAIKNNPATATIPIMMYTSQEGELYVGQARALGAVGVLPKQIKPVEVSEVLKSLRLVGEDAESPLPALPDPERAGDAAAVRPEASARDWGELHQWLQEMFEHLCQDLRVDVETSVQRLFAERDAGQAPARKRAVVLPIVTLAMAGVAGVFFWLHLDTQRKWQAAVEQNIGLMAALNSRRGDVAAGLGDAPARVPDPPRDAQPGRDQDFLAALEWGVNQSGTYPPDQVPLGEERLESLTGLLQRLTQLGFAGTVQINTYIGEFCYANSGAENFALAADDLPAERCDRIGLTPEEARSVSARQSVGFANFLQSRGRAAPIRVQVEPHGSGAPLVAYPALAQGITAGEWNRIARQNNRVTFRIIPDRGGA